MDGHMRCRSKSVILMSVVCTLVGAAASGGACSSGFPSSASPFPPSFDPSSVASLPGMCAGRTYFVVTSSLCPSAPTYFLCGDGAYTEYDCTNPGGDWSQETGFFEGDAGAPRSTSSPLPTSTASETFTTTPPTSSTFEADGGSTTTVSTTATSHGTDAGATSDGCAGSGAALTKDQCEANIEGCLQAPCAGSACPGPCPTVGLEAAETVGGTTITCTCEANADGGTCAPFVWVCGTTSTSSSSM